MLPRSFLERVTLGVPDITAETAGAFRICFGLCLLWVILPVQFDVDRSVKLATITTLALFTIGLWTRTAYAISVLGITVYAIVQKQGHSWIMPMLTLWCLLPVRWGDGFSIDAAIRRWRRGSQGTSLHGPRYGFAIWLPGLTLGTALAAAAFAKLQRSGLDWVTTGAVRFHFVEDSLHAPLTWGLWIAAHYPVAVLFSFAAVAIEAGFIFNVFFPGVRTRAAFGLVGVAVFGGFYVFQGVFWRPWWIVLTAFLPWGLIDRRVTRESQPQVLGLGVAHALTIVFVVVQQVIVSAGKIEIGPFVSWYPMYSNTYESPAHFDQAELYALRYWRYYFEIETPDGVVDVSDRIRAISGAERAIHDAVADLKGRSGPLSDEQSKHIGAVRSTYEALHRIPLHALRLSYDRRAFDWERGQFYWAVQRGDAGVLDFDAAALIHPQNSDKHLLQELSLCTP